MKRILAIGLFCLLTVPSLSVAVSVEEESVDIRTREIAKTLRCAVCQSESIWESNAELARQMRAVIRERVAEGQSADEIQAYFLSRYGDYILLKPRKSGLNWVLWAGPFVLLGVGVALLFRTLRRWVAQTAMRKPEETEGLDDRQRQRIDQEIHSFEK